MFRQTINLALMLFVVVPTPVLAGGPMGGATEWTQLANNGELLQQTLVQTDQYKTMLLNLKKLDPSVLAQMNMKKLWDDQGMNETFRNLYRVVINGQQAAYNLSSIDQQFKAIHPGYDNFGGFDFKAAYKNWSDSVRDAVKGSLRMAAVQADDLQSERDLILELAKASETAEGQIQAIQAGNRISLAMIGQMQKLRQLQMAQMQQQNTAAMATQGRSEASDDVLKKAYKTNRSVVRTYDEIIKDRGLELKP